MKRLSSIDPEPGVDLAFGFALTMMVVGFICLIAALTGNWLGEYFVHAYCACHT